MRAAYRKHQFKSTRDAKKATGIDHTLIARMLKGEVPSEATILRWASRLGEPVNSWLELAGYEPLEESTSFVTRQFTETKMLEVSYPVQFQAPDPPQAILDAIEAAPSSEDAVTIAFSYLRSLPDVRFGAADGGVMSHEGRLAIVRAYEYATGVRLLKPEII